MGKKKSLNIKPKTKKIINMVSVFLFFIFLFISLLLTINIFKLNMLPFKITGLIFLIGIILLIVFGILCLNKKVKWKIKVVSDIIITILSIILFLANHYIDRTISFLKAITNNNFETETYYVLVLKNSDFESLQDLLDKKIGFVSNLGSIAEALEMLKNEVAFENISSKSIFDLGNNLIDDKVAAILLADYHKAILDEEIEDFDLKVKIIYKFTIKKESKVESTSVDVTKDPFNIFLSGMDTYGEIDSIARSDVNMIITINPTTKNILLTSIPRDYYVELACYDGKDKLTHAGLYGIDCSIGTIENLLDIDINYYMRVNFSSLINLVDVLGGVNVYSDYSFDTYGYIFNKGYNYVNGDYALAFSRARYNFVDGDRQRGKNQQAVIRAIVNKAMSPIILSKYTDILNALKDSFQMNMSMLEIQSLAKLQLDKMPNWEISSISLNGSDSENVTYTYGDQLLYVMEPDMLTVDYASETIKKVINGQSIEAESTITDPVSSDNISTTTTTVKAVTTTTTTIAISNSSTNDEQSDNNDDEDDIENDIKDDTENMTDDSSDNDSDNNEETESEEESA